MLDVLAVGQEVAPLRPNFILQDLKTSFTDFSTEGELLLHEVVLGQIVYAKSVPWIGLESSFKVIHSFFSHFKVIYVGGDFDYSNCCQCHRVGWV